MRKPRHTVFFFILLGVTAVIIFCTLTNGHNWGDDFAGYILQAKSITQLDPRGFIDANSFTVKNSSYDFGPIAYPWGFPVLLAPFYAVFGLNIIGLKLLGVISFLIFIILIWLGFRKYHSPVWLFCLVCLFALNPTLLSFTDQILSDFPFLLLSTVSVLLTGRLIIEKRKIISPIWDYILLGAIIACAFFIRTNGFLLLISLAITQFIALILKLKQSDKPPSNRKDFLKYLSINLIPYISFFCIVLTWEAIVITGLEIFQGGQTNTEQILRRWICLVPVIIVFSYFAINSTGNACANMMRHRETFTGPYTTSAQSMFSFIKSNTEKETTIVFFKPRLMRMMTDRKSIMLRRKEELSYGDYLCLYLLAPARDQVSLDAIQSLSDEKTAFLIYENSEFKIYKLTFNKIPFMNRQGMHQ